MFLCSIAIQSTRTNVLSLLAITPVSKSIVDSSLATTKNFHDFRNFIFINQYFFYFYDFIHIIFCKFAP